MTTTTTANNHNQKELRLYAPNEQQQQTANATALASGARSPFQREVREWQRIDPDTGALLTGRLEADRWINGPLNKYGKVGCSLPIFCFFFFDFLFARKFIFFFTTSLCFNFYKKKKVNFNLFFSLEI